jgi:DNA-binding response OmpR family regulator
VRVLVIEDDRAVRETLGLVLESYDHEVELVDGGPGALDALSRSWPDAMLLDLTLEGMTGEEIYREVLARFGTTPPTVVLSAVQHGENRVRRMPGARFLAKPYTLDQLIEALGLAVASSGQKPISA